MFSEGLDEELIFQLKSKCGDEAYQVNLVVEHAKESSIHHNDIPTTNTHFLKYVRKPLAQDMK